jgi:Questin oxidase-like
MPTRRDFLGAAGAVLAAPRPSAASAASSPATALDARGPVLGPLLARNRERYTGAAKGSNHTSMALLALASLGATPAQVTAFGDILLLKNRKPFPEGGGVLTQRTWERSLGDMDALPAFRRFFAGQVSEKGVAGTLRTYLPRLIPGLSAAEFHCMIRTAYGVRFGDPDEVVVGLAYWSSAFMPLGALEAPGTVSDPIAHLVNVREQFQSASLANTDGGMAGAIKAASRVEGFQKASSGLWVDDKSLARIATAMVELFAAPGSDLLHAVTGTHAYRTLEPFLLDKLAGRRHLWQALVAYYMAVGLPGLSTPKPSAGLPFWSEIVAAAKSSTDDHGVKITHTAMEEDRLYRNVRYREVAARRWNLA